MFSKMMRGCHYDPFTNNTFFISVWLVTGNIKILQISVRNADGIPAPMVGHGFQVAVVVVFSVLFKMDDGSFLFLLWFHPYHEF